MIALYSQYMVVIYFLLGFTSLVLLLFFLTDRRKKLWHTHYSRAFLLLSWGLMLSLLSVMRILSSACDWILKPASEGISCYGFYFAEVGWRSEQAARMIADSALLDVTGGISHE